MASKISVIVPVYRVEKYLNRCIDSILNQTFTDFELIAVDDGSPDCCGEICDEYLLQDERMIAIHKPNGGVSSARNAGLDVVEGEYVTFVDSDDYLKSIFLYKLLEKDADFICQNGEFVDNKGRTVCDREMGNYKLVSINLKDVENLIANDFVGYTMGKALNMGIIREYNIAFKTDLDYCEDTVFMTEFVLKCHSAIIEDIKNYYYVKYYNEKQTLSNVDIEDLLRKAKLAFRAISMTFVDAGYPQADADRLYYKRLQSYYNSYCDEKVIPSVFRLSRNMRILFALSRDEDWIECCRSFEMRFFPAWLQDAMIHRNVVGVLLFGILYNVIPSIKRVINKFLYRNRFGITL